jgi:hypothetical protein
VNLSGWVWVGAGTCRFSHAAQYERAAGGSAG